MAALNTDRASTADVLPRHRIALVIFSVILVAQFGFLLAFKSEPFPNFFAPPFIRLDGSAGDSMTRSVVQVSLEDREGGLELLLPDQQRERIVTLELLLIKRLHEPGTEEWLASLATDRCVTEVNIGIVEETIRYDGVETVSTESIDRLRVEAPPCEAAR